MSLARVQFFSVSLDGFGTGEGQSLEAPFAPVRRSQGMLDSVSLWSSENGFPGRTRFFATAISA